MRLPILLVALFALACSSEDSDDQNPGKYPLDDVLTVNQLQAKATHNSYHQVKSPDIEAISYDHAPLDVQLNEQGVRSFELDTLWDEAAGELVVYHLPVIDNNSTCYRFFDCLTVLKTWSDSHPGHHLLLVQIEPKGGIPTPDPETTFTRYDDAILEVWPRERIVAPDDIKGSAASLREGVTTNGWPTLGATRGKILFFIDRSDTYRDAYTRGGQNLDGRLMFIDSEPGVPYEAVYVLNDPIADAAAIQSAVTDGFIVRTRADADMVEPIANDPTRRDAALASGAQIVSTDVPVKIDRFEYFVEIPGGTPSRCNPKNAPAECTSEAIEDPRLLVAP